MNLEVISRNPEHRAHPNPLLCIHGAWQGAWCWENFLPYFSEYGYEVHALSVRGHGKSAGRIFPNIQPESFRIALETTLLSLPKPRRVKSPLYPNMAPDRMLEYGWEPVADRIMQWPTGRGL